MHHKRIPGAIILFGLALVAVSAIALVATRPAKAQCGSQASSCKNCHETQAQDPVNADGTGWHESHAFGDFCYVCHGGNNQATDKVAAHTGMVAPMADVQTACAQCHPNDLQARTDVYAAVLGIPAASVGAPAAAASPAPAAATAAPEVAAQPAAPAETELSPNDPNLVDYVARYNEEVLNQHPTNWGNVILIILLVGLLGVGIFFVNRREGWISVSFTEKKALNKEYPEDVVGIADQATKLSAAARKSLAHLLAKPAATAELLAALDRLSTDESPVDKQ